MLWPHAPQSRQHKILLSTQLDLRQSDTIRRPSEFRDVTDKVHFDFLQTSRPDDSDSSLCHQSSLHLLRHRQTDHGLAQVLRHLSQHLGVVEVRNGLDDGPCALDGVARLRKKTGRFRVVSGSASGSTREVME